MARVIQPKGWPRPRGYSHGMVAPGRLLAIAGQIGNQPASMDMPRGLVPQFAQCLDNIVQVVNSAGGAATDIISMTIFVTDQRQYHAASADIGTAWRKRFGKHFPAMTLVEVKALMEPHALVEIQALAVLAD